MVKGWFYVLRKCATTCLHDVVSNEGNKDIKYSNNPIYITKQYNSKSLIITLENG